MFSVLFLVFWNNDSSRHMVAEENMEFWATVLVPFLVGAVTVLLVVLWWVLRARSMSPTSFGVLSERSRRCREPIGFGGHAEGFSEWLFAVEEAIRTLQPEDPVGYAGSFLEGNARKRLISSWGSDGRLRRNSWPGISRATVACLCRGGCGRVVSASIDSDASVGRCRHRRIHFGVRHLLFDGT